MARQPVVRCLHACWLTADGRFALYAGQTTGVRALGDLWALDGGQWAMFEGRLPPERNLPAVTRHGEDAVVFGGLGLDGDYLRDVYRVDETTLVFEELRPDGARPPPGRRGAHRRLRHRPRPVVRRHRERRCVPDTWELTLD